MIQPGRLPRSLPPTTRDARDLRASSVYDDPPFDDRSSRATAPRRSAPR